MTRAMMKRALGFTLIELLVVLAIVAIFATVAVPAMTDLINRNILASRSNTVNAVIRTARNDAIRHGRAVDMFYDDGDRRFVIADRDTGDELRRPDRLRGVEIDAPARVTFDAEGQLVGADDIVFISVERHEVRRFCIFRTGVVARAGADAGHNYCD